MRRSPIRDLLLARGAVLGERSGVEVVRSFGDAAAEYLAVREAVGLTDFSFVTRHRVPEDGLDMLERYATGSVANIRFGRVLHTMAADGDGMLESDLYIANDDETFLVLGESLVDDASTAATLEALGASEAGVEDVSGSTAVFGIDGFKAWAVAKELFGSDVLGLPYLSVETYDLDGDEVKLIRGGKTSEFGYLVIIEAGRAAALWERLESAGRPHGLCCVGVDAHSTLRLDGRFFNIHEEGRKVRDPLQLGLQWMIDFNGDDFRGKEAIAARRAKGLSGKIIGVTADRGAALAEGDEVVHGRETVGRVITAAFSPTLDAPIGLALFELPYAYAGLTLAGVDGRRIRTVSMPPFTSKSLSVKLDEL
jgi:aminomethyltransferase